MMAAFLGQWALRGYGVWACEKIGGGAFIGSIGIFDPIDWPEPRSSSRSTNPAGARVSRLKQRGQLATGCSSTSPRGGLQASFGPTITHPNASRNGWARFANAHSNCAAAHMNIGFTTGLVNSPFQTETMHKPILPTLGSIAEGGIGLTPWLIC